MDIDAYRKKLEERAIENEKAFIGKYKDEINGLLGLSKKDIDSITPDTTDLDVYDQLVTIVKVASANNIAQAELKSRIMELGDVAVKIVNKSAKLASLLI